MDDTKIKELLFRSSNLEKNGSAGLIREFIDTRESINEVAQAVKDIPQIEFPEIEPPNFDKTNALLEELIQEISKPCLVELKLK